MMTASIDLVAGDRYALQGKIVTMNPAGEVLRQGVVYIKNATIAAILPAIDPPPPSFAQAPVLRTEGTIYPGLIELHNHLSYNVLPLWEVPKRFGNREQWRQHPDRRKLISGPMKLLATSPDYVAAIVRYVECKCLFSGVTTSQGLTLSSAPGIQSLYRGVVRNVERTDDLALPEARTKVDDIATADELQERLARTKCLLLHLSEGVDDRARSHFRALQRSDGTWAITDALVGIHATALRDDDWRVLANRGAAVVWSPLSNLLLYGATIDLAAAKGSGVRIALGSDWSPTGSKNLLSELKVAFLESERQGGIFSPRELLAMATIEAARILKWDRALGSIETGKRADLLVLRGSRGDAYQRLLQSDEGDVQLVVINGVPRYGITRLMRPFGSDTERWTLARRRHLLNLADQAADVLVSKLTLAAARERLRQGMSALPHPPVIAPHAIASGLSWSLVLDEEELLRPLEPPDEVTDLLDAQAVPLDQLVTPMTLDELTVAEAPETYLGRLAVQRNLPPEIIAGLRELYSHQ